MYLNYPVLMQFNIFPYILFLLKNSFLSYANKKSRLKDKLDRDIHDEIQVKKCNEAAKVGLRKLLRMTFGI